MEFVSECNSWSHPTVRQLRDSPDFWAAVQSAGPPTRGNVGLESALEALEIPAEPLVFEVGSELGGGLRKLSDLLPDANFGAIDPWSDDGQLLGREVETTGNTWLFR